MHPGNRTYEFLPWQCYKVFMARGWEGSACAGLGKGYLVYSARDRPQG